VIGYVHFYNSALKTGAVVGADGLRYAVKESAIAEDVYGRAILIEGEPVEFSPQRDERGRFAAEIVPEREPMIFDPSYREVVTVTQWYGERGFGFAAREHNGRGLFVHAADAITLGTLRVGSVIRCLPVSCPGKAARATQIEIFIPADEEIPATTEQATETIK
jgi:cold shock CspA family protein